MNSQHTAFSDDSKHEDGRFCSLSLITVKSSDLKNWKSELDKIWKESNIIEFKWSKLRGAKYKFAGQKIVDFIFRKLDELRVDILIWDNNDSRHKVFSRDDCANTARMYYHLLSNTLGTKWDKVNSWHLYPDVQSSIDWNNLKTCLASKNYVEFDNIFGTENGKFQNLSIEDISPVDSAKNKITQIADLFAGLATSSHGDFNDYREWLNNQSGQDVLFGAKVVSKKTNKHDKFYVIQYFKTICKKYKAPISFESTNGLKTHKQRYPINFWFYDPQHEYDKAPKKSVK